MGAGQRPTPDGIISEQGDERPRDACRRRGGATVPAATQVRRRTFAPAFSPTWKRKAMAATTTVSTTDHERNASELRTQTPAGSIGAAAGRDAPRALSAATSDQSAASNPSAASEGIQSMTTSREIVFVDQSVSDLDSLLAGVRPDIEPIVLTASARATAQIATALQGRKDLRAIHIVAHGDAGEVRFGAGALSLETLAHDAGELAEIGRALGEGGE